MAVVDYPVSTHVLGNGLRVVTSTDHNVPAVAVNVRYDVGSRDEQTGRTGFAHLFEHLMFQGSGHVASGEHFSLLQAVGAVLNGTTSFDRTNYYETLPTGGFELALWLEADRTASLLDYLIPTIGEIPEVVTATTETPSPNNPLGAKGVGESGTIGSTPAVQNAVVDALSHLGVRHIDMPLTPERVWEALTAARRQGQDGQA